MKKRILRIFGFLFLIAAIIFLFLAYRQWQTYKTGNEAYDELVEAYTDDSDTGNDSGDDTFTIDWDSLQKQNPDIVGWIRMNPTVNYPIVQGKDNHYYLRRGFDKTYNINGTIFMHYENAKDWSDSNTVIYGHNMNSGVMFGNNDYYYDKSYADENPYFYIYVPDGMYTYKIFDVITTYDGTDPYEVHLHSIDAFSEYLNKMNQMKDYGTDTKVSTDDRIVSLSTCASHGKKRFIIQGVLYSFTDSDGVVHPANELKEKEYETNSNDADTNEDVEV